MPKKVESIDNNDLYNRVNFQKQDVKIKTSQKNGSWWWEQTIGCIDGWKIDDSKLLLTTYGYDGHCDRDYRGSLLNFIRLIEWLKLALAAEAFGREADAQFAL